MNPFEFLETFQQLGRFTEFRKDVSVNLFRGRVENSLSNVKQEILKGISTSPNPVHFLESVEIEVGKWHEDSNLHHFFEDRELRRIVDEIWGWDNISAINDFQRDRPIDEYIDYDFDEIMDPDLDNRLKKDLSKLGIQYPDYFKAFTLSSVLCTQIYLTAIEEIGDFISDQIIRLHQNKGLEKIATELTVEQIALFFRLFYDNCVDYNQTSKNSLLRTLVLMLNRQGNKDISFGSLKNMMKPKALLNQKTHQRVKEILLEMLDTLKKED